MTDFMAKMHQIRFRLGLRPRPRWGAYSVPLDPLAGFVGVLLREGEGTGGEGTGGRRGEGRGGEGREESVPIVPVLRNDHCRVRQESMMNSISNRVHHSFTTTTTVLKQGSIRSIVGKWNIWVMRCGSFTSAIRRPPIADSTLQGLHTNNMICNILVQQ